MIEPLEESSRSSQEQKTIKESQENAQAVKKGPLSFLSGALSSGFFAFISYQLSQRLVIYFTLHSSSYSSPIAQSVASGFKTLVIGISFLATFTFGFIGLGLLVVFIRSVLDGNLHSSG